MKKNPVQFAVVREDPQIEMEIAGNFNLNRAVLIGSGGCTAFCLKAQNPQIQIALIEPNPHQINLVKEKISILKTGDKNFIYKRFGVGNSQPDNLIECGNFESLFRQLRLFIVEFIIPENEIRKAFQNNSGQIWKEVFLHPYWKVAFELFFSDSILTAMFTEAAIQHAPKNSYPLYFQNVLEKGLLRDDAAQNYFLHHIFLGSYFEDKNSLPFYLNNFPTNFDFDYFQGFAQDYKYFPGKQLIHFSNIFDWCDEATVKKIAENAAFKLKKGSVVVYRQLNNKKDFRPFFGENFRWPETKKVVEKDRSLFYENIEIGEKIL